MTDNETTPTGRPAVSPEKLKALQLAMEKIDKTYGRGSIMKMGDDQIENIEVIPSGSIGLNHALGVGGYPRGRGYRRHRAGHRRAGGADGPARDLQQPGGIRPRRPRAQGRPGSSRWPLRPLGGPQRGDPGVTHRGLTA